jgi:hypothetical protein
MIMAVSHAIKNISLHWRCFSAAAGVFPHHVPKLLLLPTTFQTCCNNDVDLIPHHSHGGKRKVRALAFSL